MDKQSWLAYFSSRIRSQIALEAVTKAQNWALAILGFIALGFGLNALSGSHDPRFMNSTKILFLVFFHLAAAAALYGPAVLQKGRNSAAHFLGIRDFAGLMVMAGLLTFYLTVTFMLSFQLIGASAEKGIPVFFAVTAWANFFLTGAYLLFSLFCLISFCFFPQGMAKIKEGSSKTAYAGLGLHAILFLLLGLAYAGISAIGSSEFFEHFRIAGLFWVFTGASIMLASRLLRPLAAGPLLALELEVVSGRLQNQEAILARFKEVFVSQRLQLWLHRISHEAAAKAREIAKLTHDAVNHVDHEKPSELDLRHVEDRYRRAEVLSKSLEKDNQRFLVGFAWLDLTETEREKAELLRDLFSRELRNAKLELAQVRKHIDERLVSLKTSFSGIAALTSEKAPQLTLEEAPASR